MSTAADIPVVCSVCGTREYATLDQVGKGIKCPDCFTVNVVKEPPKKKAKPAVSLDDGYALKREPVATVELTCTSCHDPIRARTEHAGRKVRCPNCDEINVVPRAKEEQPAATVQLSEGVTANPTQKQIADRIMARARQELDEREEEIEIPEIPVRPFVDGVFNFPIYGNVLAMWIGLGFCMAGMGMLLSKTISLFQEQSFGMGIGLFLGLAFGVVFAFTLYVFPSKFFAIVESTAVGYDKIQFDGGDFFDRMLLLLILFNAAALGSVPGIAVASLAGAPSAMGLITGFFLFPILLISMLETTSPWRLYSETVSQSFSRIPGSWVMFYCVTVPMLVGALLLFVVALNSEVPMSGVAVAAVVFPVVAVIYFRMLGRLALMIGQADGAEPAVG